MHKTKSSQWIKSNLQFTFSSLLIIQSGFSFTIKDYAHMPMEVNHKTSFNIFWACILSTFVSSHSEILLNLTNPLIFASRRQFEKFQLALYCFIKAFRFSSIIFPGNVGIIIIPAGPPMAGFA